MDISIVVNQVLMLFIPMVVGYAISKLKVVTGQFSKNLSAFIFNVTLPCTIVTALQVSFDREILIKSGVLVIASAVIIVTLWVFGNLTSKLIKARGQMKNAVIYALMFSNFSFMGYPMAQAFMGEKGLLYAAMFSLPIYVLVQSWGVAITDGDGENHKFRMYYIFNPPLIASFIGLVLFFTGLRFPAALDGTIRSFGATTTPLAMVLAGVILSAKPLGQAFTNIKIYIVAVLRLIVLPLIVFYIMTMLKINIDICRLSAIITMMPVAANVIITSEAYGKDSTEPTRMVLLTNILSIITIPLMGLLLF